ncbi:uncharacterized protein LOC132304739 [Cornus florida]|uniref:uncharacterized protein LOC132304739 n=1 Tax=Cornus florida TaxID=4283 RepID=UPI002899A970|nr:uncharacterized protein LOC132304739 [Cornus florida]
MDSENGIGNNKKSGTDASSSSATGCIDSTISPVSNLTNESTSQSMAPPTQSPAVQVMERPAGYDPNRIPSSVFATKSPAPMEWSVASNESLFSLHMGNNSFSRDHNLMMSGDFYKPEESREFFICRDLTMSGEMVCLKPPPPPPTGMDSEPKSVDARKNNLQATGGAEDATVKNVPKVTADAQQKGKVPSLEVSLSMNRRSDVSGTSSKSFAFPILTDGGTSTAVNGEPDQKQKQQHSQPPDSKENPKTASKKWFSCFSCCPKTCC